VSKGSSGQLPNEEAPTVDDFSKAMPNNRSGDDEVEESVNESIKAGILAELAAANPSRAQDKNQRIVQE
jgi:hypothetical protein